MDKEQKELLIKAWKLSNHIIHEIRELAFMNENLAYGCLRTAETIIDMRMVDRLRRAEKEVLEAKSGDK